MPQPDSYSYSNGQLVLRMLVLGVVFVVMMVACHCHYNENHHQDLKAEAGVSHWIESCGSKTALADHSGAPPPPLGAEFPMNYYDHVLLFEYIM